MNRFNNRKHFKLDPNDRTGKVDTYLKSSKYLRQILSSTTISASFRFSSLYPGLLYLRPQ